MAPKCTMDGSPMITSQAATVFAAFRHLKGIVVRDGARSTARGDAQHRDAAVQMNPHVVMQVLQTQDDPDDQVAVVRAWPRRSTT